jgi:hypothetical protein
MIFQPKSDFLKIRSLIYEICDRNLISSDLITSEGILLPSAFIDIQPLFEQFLTDDFLDIQQISNFPLFNPLQIPRPMKRKSPRKRLSDLRMVFDPSDFSNFSIDHFQEYKLNRFSFISYSQNLKPFQKLKEIKEHPWVTKYAFGSACRRIHKISKQIPRDEQILSEIKNMVGHSVEVNSSSFLLIKREKIVEEMSYSKDYHKKSSVGSKSSSNRSECFVESFK